MYIICGLTNGKADLDNTVAFCRGNDISWGEIIRRHSSGNITSVVDSIHVCNVRTVHSCNMVGTSGGFVAQWFHNSFAVHVYNLYHRPEMLRTTTSLDARLLGVRSQTAPCLWAWTSTKRILLSWTSILREMPKAGWL